MPKASESISSKLIKLRDAIRIHGGRMDRAELAQIRRSLQKLGEYVDQVDALHDDPWADDAPAGADDPFGHLPKAAAG